MGKFPHDVFESDRTCDHAPEVRVRGTHSPQTPENRPRRKWWWVPFSLVVALPECIEASISLFGRVVALARRHDILSFSQLVREYRKAVLLVIVLLAVARFCVRPCRRVCLACVGLYAEVRGHGSRDQQAAAVQAPFYATAILVHRRILGITVGEVARALRVSRPVAWLITRRPDFVPRPEMLRDLATLLMVPQGWFEKGGSYGPGCTEARLKWFDSRKLACGYTEKEIIKADARTRAAMVKVIEKQLREELGLPREGGRHD